MTTILVGVKRYRFDYFVKRFLLLYRILGGIASPPKTEFKAPSHSCDIHLCCEQRKTYKTRLRQRILRGNRLHYSSDANGAFHTNYDECEVASYNVYSNETLFGSGDSNLRWVWLYTCNFLTTGAYVTDDSLKSMMSGAHIVMGYSSRSTLCDAMVETFAEYLRQGMPIIDAYFKAGYDGEASVESANHIQKVIYISQARNENIYSPRINYQYISSDVNLLTHDIQYPYS